MGAPCEDTHKARERQSTDAARPRPGPCFTPRGPGGSAMAIVRSHTRHGMQTVLNKHVQGDGDARRLRGAIGEQLPCTGVQVAAAAASASVRRPWHSRRAGGGGCCAENTPTERVSCFWQAVLTTGVSLGVRREQRGAHAGSSWGPRGPAPARSGRGGSVRTGLVGPL